MGTGMGTASGKWPMTQKDPWTGPPGPKAPTKEDNINISAPGPLLWEPLALAPPQLTMVRAGSKDIVKLSQLKTCKDKSHKTPGDKANLPSAASAPPSYTLPRHACT
jgi:hypothetical protein